MRQCFILGPLIILLLFSTGRATADPAPSGPAKTFTLTAEEKTWLEEHPVIRTRISTVYPPFEFFADNRYQGLAVDYLSILSRRLGLEFRPVGGLTWPESVSGLNTAETLDLILLITRTPERANQIEFTRGYISFPLVIINRKDAAGITGLKDLDHQVVSVERGYNTDVWLQRDHPLITHLKVDTTEEALKAVSTGKADAYLGNLAVAGYLIDRLGLSNLKVAAASNYGNDNLCMGVRKDWPELARLIDKVLAAMPPEEHQALRQKWIKVRYEYGIKGSDIAKWVVLVIGIALIWIVQLRFAVRRSTTQLRREITLRKEKEEALQKGLEELRDAHQRLEFHVNRMPLGYIAWNTDFRVSEWNPEAEKIFGWTAAETMGRHAHDLMVPPEAFHQVDEIWNKLLQGEESSFSVTENIRKDGRRIICEWYNTPLRDLTGAVAGVLSIVQDITERRREEEKLRNQFEQISTIFDSINAVVYVADLRTNELLYLNRFGISLFGDDWKGKACFRVLQGDQDTVCPFCTNDLLVENGKPLEPYVWEFRNSVTGRWFQCIDRALHWPDGRLVRMEIAFDITDRKEMEQIKDQMISAVSHEIHTPLTAAMGYTEFLIENEVAPSRQKEYLRTIYRETERLHELVDTFLDLQRFKARQVSPNFRSLDVQPILEESLAPFLDLSALHRFRLDCSASQPRIWGDAEMLKKLFANLLSNAIKYSPEGGTISLGARQDGSSMKMWVQDEGIGIPAEDLGKIFERFYRVDNSDKRSFGGAGLGLALVREIVGFHEGRVWAERNEGKGSTFYFSVPLNTESD